MRDAVADNALLKPIAKALSRLERHAEGGETPALRPDQRARLEGMNGLFQAARSRASGYRNEANFIAMIYLIGSPVGHMLDHTKSTWSDEAPFLVPLQHMVSNRLP
ncbi:transposase [Halomonas koreensis]|uniref:transposase n=1 Tax=Halomonas koreensis TaxID=245385 RepID=UPI0035B5598D